MAWFDFLKTRGFFDPEKNPDPVQSKEGYQIPYWEVLDYLEKLSQQIKEGDELEYAKEIISIIKDVSEHPKDNYRTWYRFIKILDNLPSDKVPNEILHFIPTWLNSKFMTLLPSSELCQKLLPKFLNENPTHSDIEKAEIILNHLFEVHRIETGEENTSNSDHTGFYSRVHLRHLSEALTTKKLIPKIIRFCSDTIILNLGHTLKKLLLDYPNGITSVINNSDKEYEIKAMVHDKDLLISSRIVNQKNLNAASRIVNFENLNENQLRYKFEELINKQGITYKSAMDPDDSFQRINYAVNNDLYSSLSFSGIRELGEKHHHNEKVLDAFGRIFRDLLAEKVKQDPNRALELLRTICYDRYYKLPFFKRVALYIISENWESINSFFWELINDSDKEQLFTKNVFQKELYELLQKCQHLLKEDEKESLNKIIIKGPQSDPYLGKKDKDYWQMRWYSALKATSPFKEEYTRLSESLAITHKHFEDSGKAKIRGVSDAPFSTEEVLQKSNQEIVDFLHSFSPKNIWEEPTIDGLANILEKAVETEPEKFAEEISLYKNANYFYVYYILMGFRVAWKERKKFNWENVLAFCQSYVSDDKFYSSELELKNDFWHANANWVAGSIANLLTEGMQSDQNAFDIELLSVAREILIYLTNNLKPEDIASETTITDYPTYSLNSTAGKVLRALFDYSLRRARNYLEKENTNKWDLEILSLFEKTMEKGIIDGYIMEGMYFEQFYYLDKNWITERIKMHYNIADREWLALMGGFSVCNPPSSTDTYQLFYPHYERAISNNIDLSGVYNHGLIRHLVAFYFWGYEDLDSEGLILKLFNYGNTKFIIDFVNYIWQQEDYYKSLNEGDKLKFEGIILRLWTFLTNKYQKPKDEEEQKVLVGLVNFIVFVRELNETVSKLLIKSAPLINQNSHADIDKLLENLIELKEKGNPQKTAEHIGQIFLSLDFKEYWYGFSTGLIIELVTFLYQYGQKKTANIFCNRLSSQQHNFLKEIYRKFNP